MVKLFGVFFLIFGAVGFSACLCREVKSRLIFLKEMKNMFLLIQSQIQYGGIPINRILQEMTGKMQAPLCEVLQKISERLFAEDGEEFASVWNEEMEAVFISYALTKEQKALLLRFPEVLGAFNREGQAQSLYRYIDELDKWIEQGEKEEKDRNKIIMSLGTAAGILLSILLL